MTVLADGLQALGAAALNTFWLPLLAWTVIALFTLGLLRVWRSASPLIHYAARTALLSALPLGLLLAATTDLSFLALWPQALAEAPGEPLALLLQPEVGQPVGTLAPSWTLVHSLGVLTLGATLLAALRLGLLARQAFTLHQFRRHLSAPEATTLQQTTDHLAATLGLRQPIQAVVTTRPVVPMTLGWRHPLIVVPAPLLHDDDGLHMALLHELIHIRRRDVLFQNIEQTVGAVFAINPVLGLLRRSISAYREMVCDAEVVSQPKVSSKHYAALLYRFVSPRYAPRQLALSMASSEKQLKKRILAMKTHRSSSTEYARPKIVAFLLAGLLLSSATLIVACTDIVGADIETPADVDAQVLNKADGDVFVVVEEMPELIGGLSGLQQEITYPHIAKKAGIEGRVILQFIVDEQGNVTEPAIVRGIGAGCDEEAMRALQTVQFKPGLQDGKPVKVKMSIPVTFKLGNGDTASASESVRLLNETLQFTHPEMSKEKMDAFMRELYAEMGKYREEIAAKQRRLTEDLNLTEAEKVQLKRQIEELRERVRRHIEERYKTLNEEASN